MTQRPAAKRRLVREGPASSTASVVRQLRVGRRHGHDCVSRGDTPRTPSERKDEIRQQLLDYRGLDAYALMRLRQYQVRAPSVRDS